MMHDQFHDLVADGEGPRVEFKRSLTKDFGRELSTFANADGGVILLGVADSGRVVGVDKPNRMKSRIQSTARSADPPIDVEIDRIAQALRVSVPPQDRKPYSFGGRFFKRVGASSQQMSRVEVEDLFYSAGRLHFDRTPCPAFLIERDLDDDTWARFSRRGKIPESMDRIVALQNLGLVDARQRMTHAGAWLMAQDIRTLTTSAHISCALFLGTDQVPHPRPAGLLPRRTVDDRRHRGLDPQQDQCRAHHQRCPPRGTTGAASGRRAGGRRECGCTPRLPLHRQCPGLRLQGPG